MVEPKYNKDSQNIFQEMLCENTLCLTKQLRRLTFFNIMNLKRIVGQEYSLWLLYNSVTSVLLLTPTVV